MPFDLPESIRRYYEDYDEAGRLSTGPFQLEFVRTQEILLRHLPPAPAVILDVGGGPGVYSCWLAAQGYETHLIDAVPSHLEKAKRLSAQQPAHPIASYTIGDARQLLCDDQSVDAVLLLGPLYHLTDRQDRIAALKEAHRVLRSGGRLFAAAISRFASVLSGLSEDLLDDPQFLQIARGDLTDGQHRNPTDNIMYFTDAYFHRADELEMEIKEAGFCHEKTLSIEGFAGWLHNFSRWWDDPQRRELLLEIVRRLEAEPSLIGASAHFMGIAGREKES